MYESLRTLWLVSIPYIGVIFWLLSKLEIINDNINAMDTIIPFIGFLLFGDSITNKYDVDNAPCCISFDCLDCNLCDFCGKSFDNVKRKMDHMKFLMADGKWNAYFSGSLAALQFNSTDNDSRYTIGRYLISFTFAMISIIVRVFTDGFQNCQIYCIFCLITGFFFNFLFMNHILLNVVQKFFDVLRWYGHTMKKLTNVLSINLIDRQNYIFLYEAENAPKWFELWSVIQIVGSRGFKAIETNLLGIIISTLGASIILVYQYIFGHYTTELTVGMLYLWVIFLLIIIYIAKYSKYFDELQSKQILLLTSQNQYINNLMLQIQLQFYSGLHSKEFDLLNNKVIYYRNVCDLVTNFQSLISQKTLSPTIMGLKFDKICYRFFVFFVVSIVPGLFNILQS